MPLAKRGGLQDTYAVLNTVYEVRTGNPRAKGQVEKANDIVETQFECLLKVEPVQSIDELNEATERWCAAFNANRLGGAIPA